MIKICKECNKEYNAKKSKQKFCSFDCRVSFQRKSSLEHEKKCLCCGTLLKRRQKKYCSFNCRSKYQIENYDLFKDFYKERASKNIGKIKAERKKYKCPVCSIEFEDRVERKFCSKKCHGKFIYDKCLSNYKFSKTPHKQKRCKFCDNYFDTKGKNKNQKFCSKDCSFKYKKKYPEEYVHIYEAVKRAHKEGKFAILYKLSSERMKRKNPSHDPKVVKKQQESLKKFYKNNPEKLEERIRNFINAPARGRGKEGREPTKLEKFVIKIDSKKIRYTGNGVFWLTFKNGKRKNPDFKVNGVRKVIEVGDTQFWHTLDEIEKTVAEYKKIGYECLYLTDVHIYEEPEESKNRILKFIENGELRTCHSE